MPKHLDQTPKHTNSSSQHTSRSQTNKLTPKPSGDDNSFQWVDNRPEVIAQRKLQEMAEGSLQAKQLKAFPKPITQNRTISHYGGVLTPKFPATTPPAQLMMQYGDTHTLHGGQGQVHWHYSFDDTNINSLHLTIADTRNYQNRTWASRQSYTPTGANTGNWTDWVNNHGHTPAWATGLARNQGRGPAEQAFHGNQQIAALLANAFPQAQPDLNNQALFPSLGASGFT